MKGKNKDLTFAWDKKALVELGVPILAGFLVFSSLVRTVAPFPDILIALITGLFMGLFFRDLKRAAIAGFLVGSIGSFVFEFSPLSVAFLGLPAIIVFFFQGLIAMLGSILAASIRAKEIKKLIIFCLLGFILMNFALNATVLNSGILQVASYEPPAEEYAFDGFIYLKTFYLLKGGMNYYKANGVATIQDARFSRLPWQVQFFRLPTMFFLWSWFLPDGAGIVYLFVLFSLICLIASYFFASRFVDDHLALLAPFLLAPYLLYGVVTFWFPFVEYWGAFFAILALTFYAYNKIWPAVLFTLLAIITRELFIFLVVPGLILALIRRDRAKFLLWLTPLGAFMLFYLVHYLLCKPFLAQAVGPPASYQGWLNGGLGYLSITMGFGMNLFTRFEVVKIVLVAMGLAGALMISDKDKRFFYGGLLLLPILAFLVIGTGKWGGYWGIIYMPFALIYVPLFFRFALNLRDRLPSRRKNVRHHGEFFGRNKIRETSHG